MPADCLAAAIEPTSGRMALGNEVIDDNGRKTIDLRDRIGFVVQAPRLISFLHVVDNLALLPMLAGSSDVSIARALGVTRILSQMTLQVQTAIIVVTHDEKIIPTFKRIYPIRDGQTVAEAGEGRALES